MILSIERGTWRAKKAKMRSSGCTQSTLPGYIFFFARFGLEATKPISSCLSIVWIAA